MQIDFYEHGHLIFLINVKFAERWNIKEVSRNVWDAYQHTRDGAMTCRGDTVAYDSERIYWSIVNMPYRLARVSNLLTLQQTLLLYIIQHRRKLEPTPKREKTLEEFITIYSRLTKQPEYTVYKLLETGMITLTDIKHALRRRTIKKFGEIVYHLLLGNPKIINLPKPFHFNEEGRLLPLRDRSMHPKTLYPPPPTEYIHKKNQEYQQKT
jgi:hypothetical protein